MRIDGEHLDEIRMVQVRNGTRFAQEAGNQVLVVNELITEHLDRDKALQALFPGLVDNTHTTAAKLSNDLVPADGCRLFPHSVQLHS